MTTSRLSLRVVMVVAGLALLAATAAPGERGAAEARKGGTLRLATFDETAVSLDTGLAYASWAWVPVHATCAKLFTLDSRADGLRVVPEVVDDWDVSRDGRTYTFQLKQSFRFNTGARVTAQSFADALHRNARPELRSPAADYMREIVGVDAVSKGTAGSVSGVRVLGRYRLQIRLTRPVGDFTARLTMPFFCPVPPGTPPTEVEYIPAGSGPYYVADRVRNRQIVLERNPYYRGGRPANVDEIVWQTNVPRDACLAAVQHDLLDHCVANSTPQSAWGPLAEQYGINKGRLFRGGSLATWFLVFNHDRAAFRGRGQIPLKKAINFAIDRPALTRPVGYLAGSRTDQLLPPALGARAESIYPVKGSNIAAAARLLRQARVRPPKLVLYASNSSTQVTWAQSVMFDLGRLGIDVEVKYFDAGVLLERIETRGEPFDLAFNGWGADYPDGAGFLERILNGKDLGPIGSTGNINTSYFDDPETNARIEAASRLTGEARRTAWADLDVDLMRNNPPVAPIFHSNTRAFVSKSFGCFSMHPFYGVDIAAACKK